METEKSSFFSAFSIFLSRLFLELYNNVLHNYIVEYRKGDYTRCLQHIASSMNFHPITDTNFYDALTFPLKYILARAYTDWLSL